MAATKDILIAPVVRGQVCFVSKGKRFDAGTGVGNRAKRHGRHGIGESVG